MELVLIIAGVTLLDLAALRWGVNSRGKGDTREL
jgi:hypothetical protein